MRVLPRLFRPLYDRPAARSRAVRAVPEWPPCPSLRRVGLVLADRSRSHELPDDEHSGQSGNLSDDRRETSRAMSLENQEGAATEDCQSNHGGEYLSPALTAVEPTLLILLKLSTVFTLVGPGGEDLLGCSRMQPLVGLKRGWMRERPREGLRSILDECGCAQIFLIRRIPFGVASGAWTNDGRMPFIVCHCRPERMVVARGRGFYVPSQCSGLDPQPPCRGQALQKCWIADKPP